MDLKEFNWKQYLDNYPDLIKAGINNKNQALNHYINSGLKEGRTDKINEDKYYDLNEIINKFNWKQYLKNYHDLVKIGIINEQDAINYYNKIKEYENKFNWKRYLKNYPDLIQAGLKNEHDAINHYNNYGLKEGRTDRVYLNINPIIYNKIEKNFKLEKNIINKIYGSKNLDDIYDYIDYFKKDGIENGIFINQEQIKKFYDCLIFDNYIYYQEKNYSYNDFINLFFKNKTFDELFENIILFKKQNLDKKNFKNVILIHGGNKKKLKELLDKFKKYKNNTLFLITSTEKLPNSNLKKLDNYIFYLIKNIGNDLIPSIKILLDNIDIKYNYILKLHTKSDDIIYNNFINFFYENFDRIINILDNNNFYNFITLEEFKYNLSEDKFCKKILNNKIDINIDNYFCAISFFMCRKEILEKNIKLIYSLLKPSLINCFYYDNLMFQENSPIHSIERLISVDNKDKILGLNNLKNKRIAVNIASHINSDLNLYILENNIKKILNDKIDIYIYYSGTINIDFKNKYTAVKFKESNNINLDFGKHFDFYNDNINKYDDFILTNDSIILLEDINSFIDFIKLKNKGFIGYLETNILKKHYQSWMWYLNKNNFKLLKKKFLNKSSHFIELNFIDKVKIDDHDCFFKNNKPIDIFYNSDFFYKYYNNYNFKILKKKQIILTISNTIYNLIDKNKLPFIDIKIEKIPDDFNHKTYLKYNLDLINLNKEELETHFINHGLYEFRKYTDNNKQIINPLFINILDLYEINLFSFIN